jgi:hypothetical protein
MEIATNETLFRMTCQLWREAYCHSGEELCDLSDDVSFKWHPFGPFNCERGYMVSVKIILYVHAAAFQAIIQL